MRAQRLWLKRTMTAGLLLMLWVSMTADAGLSGLGGDSWKEEVLLHDGSKLIVTRSQTYGGRHEIGQPAPIREHTVSFTLRNSNKNIAWVSEYGEDIGRANFNVLAVHVLNGTPYIVASPNLCLSYNKWGRPNPPYVFFKNDGKEWQRIPPEQFPAELKTINVAIHLGANDLEAMGKLGVVPWEDIKERNSRLTQPEYRTILREPLANAAGRCGELVYDGKGGWIGIGWFRDQPTFEACLRYCERKQMGAQYCPCGTLFRGREH